MTGIDEVLSVLRVHRKAVSRELKASLARQADIGQVEMSVVALHPAFRDARLWSIGGVLRRALMALERSIDSLTHARRQLDEFVEHVYWLGKPPGGTDPR